MSFVRRVGSVAAAAVLAIVLTASTAAQARNGRIAAGVDDGFADGAVVGVAVGGFHWGPSPPYYPYYHYGYYGVPVGWPGPFWGPYEYGCDRQAAWTGRHRRHGSVCD
jgi:hypothetical protein